MIIFNKDTERNNGRKDRAQDIRIDSLQSAVDELNADIAEIEITVENLSQSINDKYAAQTQTLMSELNFRIQSLISNLEDFVNTSQVNADVGNFKNLYATVLSNLKNLTVDLVSVTGSASIAAATITSEEVTISQIQTLQATTATISELTVTLLHLANISATNITAEKVTADEVETDLLKADEARADVVKAKNITGKGWHTPIGTPDNTELLKITIPNYEGIIQIQTADDEFNVSVFNNALVSWSEKEDYLFRIQRTGNATELYLQNIGDTVDYRLLFIGSEDTVVPTSEIVDKTGIRQNVLTFNGVYGAGGGEGGSGSQIIFVDELPSVGEEGVIYLSKTQGAWVWNDNDGELVPLTGTDLQERVQTNTENIGNLSDLTTTADSDLVSAINEVDSDAGNLTNLTTTEKANLVSAINEVDSNADLNAGAIATINGNDAGLSMRQVAQDVAGNVYIPCGSVLFANLPSLSSARIGDVYNVEDSFTTTADFVEGAGIVVSAGTNVVAVDSNGAKKWDVLGVSIDTSSFMQKHNPTGTGAFSMGRNAGSVVGQASHAEGANTIASAQASHAEGTDTSASGDSSHAEGLGTIAKGDFQHVQGKYNVEDTNGIYADIVGNGSGQNRKNIEATTWTGDKRLKGTVYINCNDDSTGGYAVVEQVHNIPRIVPKDLTDYYNDGTLWKRLNGTDGFSLFEDIYAGDYFQMSRGITCPNSTDGTQGTSWVTIAEIDGMMYQGYPQYMTARHLVMVPGKGIDVSEPNHFGRHAMNDSNTTAGAYTGSKMFTDVIGAVVSSGSTASGATINQQLYAEFGSHLQATGELLSTAMDSGAINRFGNAGGASNSWDWRTCQAVLLSEIEVYGSVVWSSSGYDTGTAKRQFAAFRHPLIQNNRSSYYWLKDVVSAAFFCGVSDFGLADYDNAGSANRYVRPRFVLAA